MENAGKVISACFLLLVAGAAERSDNSTDAKKPEKLEERRDSFRVNAPDLFYGPSNGVSQEFPFDLSRLHFQKFPNSVRSYFVVGRPATVMAAHLRPDIDTPQPSYDDDSEDDGIDDVFVHGNYDRPPSESHSPLRIPNFRRPRGYPPHFSPNVLPPPRPSPTHTPPAFAKMLVQVWKANKGGAVGQAPVGVYRVPVRIIPVPHDGSGFGEGKVKHDPMALKQVGPFPLLILRLSTGRHVMIPQQAPYGTTHPSPHNRPAVVYED